MTILQVCAFQTAKNFGGTERSAQHKVNEFLSRLQEVVPSAKAKDIRLADVENSIETWYCVIELDSEDASKFNEYLSTLY